MVRGGREGSRALKSLGRPGDLVRVWKADLVGVSEKAVGQSWRTLSRFTSVGRGAETSRQRLF